MPTLPVKALTLLLVLAPSLVGCAGRSAEWSDPAPEASSSPEPGPPQPVDGLLAQASEHWAQRGEQSELQAAIGLWEQVVRAQPQHRDALVHLAHAYYFLADGFLRDEEAGYLVALDHAAKWGERAMLASSPEFASRVRQGQRVTEAIRVMPAEGLPAMYWYASALGKWSKRKGLAVMLGQRDVLRATMDRVLALDPEFFYGGPHRYFGAFYAVAPEVVGGDLEKSKVHFKKAIEIAPGYVGTKVLWAEELAVRLQDEELFVRLLNEVLETPDDVLPDLVFETRVEKAKAQELLLRKDELF